MVSGARTQRASFPTTVPFFIEYDKTQAEWVVVAYEADDQNMIAAVESATDVHAWTAHLMSCIPLDEIAVEDAAIGHTTSEDEIKRIRLQLPQPACRNLVAASWLPRNMSLRQAGKKSNHALNYGEGPNLFAQINGLSVADAKHLIRLYNQAYPNLARWHNNLRMELERPVERAGAIRHARTLTNCFGREMFFMGPLSGKLADATLRQAYSCKPQSTVADLTANAMVEVDAQMAGRVRLVSNNHDSLLIEHYFDPTAPRETEIARVLNEMNEIIAYMNPELTSTATGRKYHIRTDAKAGTCWGTLKAIEPTIAEVGKLLESLTK